VFFCILGFDTHILPESPLFLANWGRKEEAREVLQSLADSNKQSLSTDFQTSASSQQESWHEKLSMLFGPHLRLSTLILIFSTFNLNFLFYGGLYAFPQVLQKMSLGVSPATNLLFGALSEYVGSILGFFIASLYSRKRSMLLFYLVMIVSLSMFVAGSSAEAIGNPSSLVIKKIIET